MAFINIAKAFDFVKAWMCGNRIRIFRPSHDETLATVLFTNSKTKTF